MRPKTTKSNLTGDEYRQLMKDVDLSGWDVSILLGMDEKTPQRYVSGEQKIPVAAALPLVLMKERPELKELILEISERLKEK